VQRLTGADFFAPWRASMSAATADIAVAVRLWPRPSSLHRRYDYAQTMPWLADVARIERAWLDAYHAADAAPPRRLRSPRSRRNNWPISFSPHTRRHVVRSHSQP
jgi:hypothetical protein